MQGLHVVSMLAALIKGANKYARAPALHTLMADRRESAVIMPSPLLSNTSKTCLRSSSGAVCMSAKRLPNTAMPVTQQEWVHYLGGESHHPDHELC